MKRIDQLYRHARNKDKLRMGLLGKEVDQEVLREMSLEDKILGGYYKTQREGAQGESGKQKKRKAVIS